MLSRPTQVLLGPLLVVLFLAGCTNKLARDLDPEGQYTGHYLLVHADGYAIDSDHKGLTTERLETYLNQHVIAGIHRHAGALRQSLRDCDGRLRILIFVHGGLNSYDESFDRMKEMLVKDTAHPLPLTCYYPVFINWDSGLGSSFEDDLFRIRFGRHAPFVGAVTWPVLVVGRLASSIANLPMALAHNGDNIVEAWKGAGEQQDPWYCRTGDVILHLPLQGLYVVTIPLVEGFGRPLWDMMKRRAQLAVSSRVPDGPGVGDAFLKPVVQTAEKGKDFLVQRFGGKSPEQRMQQAPEEAELPKDDWSKCEGGKETRFTEGAVRTLIRCLKQNIAYDGKTWNWVEAPAGGPSAKTAEKPLQVEITLVGHSMGALLLNRILSVLDSEAPARRGVVPLPVTHLIYMAPAASVNEIEDFVVPYLEYNQGAKISIFALNRRDENREIPWDGALFFMPRGSLLAWIDTFLEPQAWAGQSTAGRVKNLRDYYGIERLPRQPGTSNCFTPTWDAKNGPPPEKQPVNKLYRHLHVKMPPVTRQLQQAQPPRFGLYESPGRVRDETVPLEHGDFTKSYFFVQVLCHVDMGAFLNKDVCTQKPYWLAENQNSTWEPVFERN